MQQLNDRLDDLLAGPRTDRAAPPKAYEAIQASYTEPCKKCNGSGVFRGWSGRSVGQCFACKGQRTVTYKTAPAERAAAKTQRVQKAANETAQNVLAFKDAEPAVFAWMNAECGRFDFARKMVEAIAKYGSLTENQLAACKRLVERNATRQQERAQREASAPAVDISRIEAAFDAARGSLKSPKLRLAQFTFKPAGAASKNAGSIYVTDGGEYLGRITSGRFVCVGACGKDREEKIVAACADPEAAAIAYGRETGSCACCGRELTDPVSVERGIGPVCATKWGW